MEISAKTLKAKRNKGLRKELLKAAKTDTELSLGQRPSPELLDDLKRLGYKIITPFNSACDYYCSWEKALREDNKDLEIPKDPTKLPSAPQLAALRKRAEEDSHRALWQNKKRELEFQKLLKELEQKASFGQHKVVEGLGIEEFMKGKKKYLNATVRRLRELGFSVILEEPYFDGLNSPAYLNIFW